MIGWRGRRGTRQEPPPVRAARATANPVATITGMKAGPRSTPRQKGGGWLASGVTTNTYLPNIMIILELEPRTRIEVREGGRNGGGREGEGGCAAGFFSPAEKKKKKKRLEERKERMFFSKFAGLRRRLLTSRSLSLYFLKTRIFRNLIRAIDNEEAI